MNSRQAIGKEGSGEHHDKQNDESRVSRKGKRKKRHMKEVKRVIDKMQVTAQNEAKKIREGIEN